jgi:hypothetical protein
VRIQEAIVKQLQQTSTATYAIVGTKVYWGISGPDPTPPYVRLRKAGHSAIASGLTGLRLPARATIEVISFGKSQEAAADLADAVASDLIGYCADMPNTSPPTSGAVRVSGIEPSDESDLMSEEALEKNLFAESREYFVDYR